MTVAQDLDAVDSGVTEELLKVDDLSVHFPARHGGVVRAVDGVSLRAGRGRTLGLVGESGSGKSTTGRAVLGLVKPTGGRVELLGRDITRLHRRELRAMRRHMQFVMQNPYASLSPRMTVDRILAEPLRIHGVPGGGSVDGRIAELLDIVGLDSAARKRYPHEFSGGQRQRIGIARALAVNPDFVVCDEPVSALDVSIQAQIVNLLETLQRQLGVTYLFIAHDLGVVRHISDEVAVMYSGQIVESADCDELYASPLHPYTKVLLESVPVPSPREQRERMAVDTALPAGSSAAPVTGCRFAARCPFAEDRCRAEMPVLESARGSHQVACHRWREIGNV